MNQTKPIPVWVSLAQSAFTAGRYSHTVCGAAGLQCLIQLLNC